MSNRPSPARRRSSPATAWQLDPLEPRELLAWGTYPVLIGQDKVPTNFPAITGKGVNIAVIDSGVDFAHPALAGTIWTNPGEIAGNGKDDDADGYVDDVNGWDFYRNDNRPEDENNHGTAMAGIIAAKAFTFGGAQYAGVATGAKIIPLKVSDPTGAAALAFSQRVEKALQWVEVNATRYNIRIVSMSIRTTDSAEYFATYSDEVARLAAKGVLMIAAGGQENANADVVYPAADPNVFGVSVVRSNDTFPTTTLNRGPGIDLLAPGSGVPVALRGTTGYAASAEATSYATPFVSGAAALLLQLNPTFTPAQVIQTFKDSGKTVTDTSTGFTYSGRSYKRINLYDALRLASDRYTTQSNFLGTAIASNTTIQAENFDAGTDGVAYHDVDAGATSTLTRTSGAELVATTDAGGGYAIGSTRAGEWLEYTVNFATAGNFTFGARLASLAAGGRFHVEVDGVDATGPLTVQATGSAATWANMASAPFAVTAGRHVVRVAFDAAGSAGIVASFNHFYFTSVAYTSVNIGPSLGATTAVQAPSAYNLSSNGADIWGRSDSFRFVYRPVTGNFDAVVRVASLGATSPWSKAGLMVRDSLAANSRNVFALVTPGSNGYRMQTRTVAGGLSTLVGGTAAVAYPNTWVRLTRVGNVFTAYRSTDGTNWTAYATTTLALNSTVYLGVALSSGNAALTNGVKFRGMRV